MSDCLWHPLSWLRRPLRGSNREEVGHQTDWTLTRGSQTRHILRHCHTQRYPAPHLHVGTSHSQGDGPIQGKPRGYWGMVVCWPLDQQVCWPQLNLPSPMQTPTQTWQAHDNNHSGYRFNPEANMLIQTTVPFPQPHWWNDSQSGTRTRAQRTIVNCNTNWIFKCKPFS